MPTKSRCSASRASSREDQYDCCVQTTRTIFENGPIIGCPNADRVIILTTTFELARWNLRIDQRTAREALRSRIVQFLPIPCRIETGKDVRALSKQDQE